MQLAPSGLARALTEPPCGVDRALVQRPHRGPHHQAEAGAPADVRPRQARPAAGSAGRSGMTSAGSTKSSTEPCRCRRGSAAPRAPGRRGRGRRSRRAPVADHTEALDRRVGQEGRACRAAHRRRIHDVRRALQGSPARRRWPAAAARPSSQAPPSSPSPARAAGRVCRRAAPKTTPPARGVSPTTWNPGSPRPGCRGRRSRRAPVADHTEAFDRRVGHEGGACRAAHRTRIHDVRRGPQGSPARRPTPAAAARPSSQAPPSSPSPASAAAPRRCAGS